MNITIHQPLAFNQQGGRSNNEDSVFPPVDSATTQQTWFMVCDGVGGAARGEIASRMAVDAFDDYFRKTPTPVATQPYLEAALTTVQAAFDDYLTRYPDGRGMATTLTMLYLHEAGATVTHIGDSRVYHVRDGRIVWRTQDHSLVNELVKAGVITPEQAREHPQRNVIERAIQGGSKPVKPDVQLLNDLRPGDYFFLCTDGVLERVSDELLENILGKSTSNEAKIRALLDCCEGQTRDNFSAYLIQIKEVSGEVPAEYRVASPGYTRTETPPDEGVEIVTVVPKKDPESLADVVPPPPVYVAPIPQPPPVVPPPPTAMKGPGLIQIVAVAVLAGALTLGGYFTLKKIFFGEKTEVSPGKKPRHGQPANTQSLQKDSIATDGLPATGQAASSAIQNADTGSKPEKHRLNGGIYTQKEGQKWRLWSESSKQPISPPYDQIKEPRENLMAVKNSRGWGYIRPNGTEAIACQYDQAGDFKHGKAQVELHGQVFQIDTKGNPVDEALKAAQEAARRGASSTH